MKPAAVKMILFITKQARLTDKEFRDYYETTHAPLSRRLFPMVGDYRRNFVDKIATVWPEGESLPAYDVITEMSFDTLADYQSFRQEIARPEVISQIRADEANFLETQATRRLIVIEEISPASHINVYSLPTADRDLGRSSQATAREPGQQEKATP